MGNLAVAPDERINEAAQINIELFKPEDRTEVCELIIMIQRDEFEIPITLEQQPDLADIPGFYQHGKGNFWVAKHGTRVVGTVSLLDIGDDRLALRKMFVHSDFRGTPYRTAQHLLNEAIGWSKRAEIREIILGTTAKYLAAHRFYEKNGFVEIAKDTLPKSFPVMPVDTKFYKLEI